MTTGNKDLLSPEALKTKDSLGDEQVEALHGEALKMRQNGGKFEEELEPEDKTKKVVVDDKDKKETAPEDEEEDDLDDKETQKTPEVVEQEKKDKAAKDAQDLAEANKKLIETPDDKLDDAGKQKKSILLRDKAEAELTEEATALSKASEGKVSLEDAKKDLISRNKIAEKYKNDPKEMAKALLHSNREFQKLQQEYKQLKEAPRPSSLKPGEAIIDGKIVPAEEVREILIGGYREENPKLTDGLEDDKVYDLAVAQMEKDHKANQVNASNQLKVDAKDKRSKILATISDSEKEYGEEITKLVNETPDHILMNEQWSFDDVKAWARGNYYTQEKLDAIRAEGFKKGREEAEILGTKEIESRPGSGGKNSVTKTTAANQLSETQKDRAREMFKTEGLTDDEKFAMYMDTPQYKNSKKN